MSDTPAQSPPLPSTAQDIGRRRAVIAAVVSGLVFLILDLVTKSWAWNNIRESPRITRDPEVVLPRLQLQHRLGLRLPARHDFSRPLFIVITLATVIYMAVLVRKLPTQRLYGFHRDRQHHRRRAR
jgi:hypothetical protein